MKSNFQFLVRRSLTQDDLDAVSRMCEYEKDRFTESLRPSELDFPCGPKQVAIILSGEYLAMGVVQNSGRNTTLQDRINYSHIRWWTHGRLASELRRRLPGETCSHLMLDPEDTPKIVGEVRLLHPELAEYLDHLVSLLNSHGPSLPPDIGQERIDALTMGGDAFNIALRVAEMPTDISLGWNVSVDEDPLGIMDGFSAYLDEDSVIASEAGHFFEAEGYSARHFTTRGFEFRNAGRVLAVVDVNRRGGEKVLGADMIIYDATRSNAVLMQYKMMDGSGSGRGYRPELDANLKGEIERWRKWEKEFGKSEGRNPREYRLCSSPYYMKLCPRRTYETFSPSELIAGMIMPLDLLERICNDKDLARGPQRGKVIGFNNIENRYLINTDFKELFVKGWIGTSCNAASIWQIARASLENDKSVLAAFIIDSPDEA